MSRREVREILASAGLSLIATPKKRSSLNERGRGYEERVAACHVEELRSAVLCAVERYDEAKGGGGA